MEYRRVTLQRLAAMAFAEALMEAKSVRAGACVEADSMRNLPIAHDL